MQHKINFVKSRTAIFDWLFFLICLSLGFIFPSLGHLATSLQFSYWMLAALLIYTFGVWLKHQPVFYRLLSSGKQIEKMPAILFIILGHWIIFMMVEQFSEPAIREIFKLPAVNTNRTDGEVVLVSGLVATFVTWLVFRSAKKSITKRKLSASYLFRRELIADIFLVVSISFLSFLFWEKGVMSFLFAKPATTIKDIWFLFAILSISFILFYLPLRYLFLIEDYSSRLTWKRLLLIFGLLLLKSLFDLLLI